MKSWHVHYMNKYPGGHVESSDSSLRVYDADGKLKVSLVKNGAGQWVCNSEELGLEDKHDLAPIPKDARLYKLCKETGKIIKDDLHDERKAGLTKFSKGAGKVLSCAEYQAAGDFKFDEKQRIEK